MKTSANGAPIQRQNNTIFVKLPRSQWTEIEGGCSCAFCKAVPGRKAYWDTLAVSATRPNLGDHAWTVHQPSGNPEGLVLDETDREGNRAKQAA